jgi:hypothetical protein
MLTHYYKSVKTVKNKFYFKYNWIEVLTYPPHPLHFVQHLGWAQTNVTAPLLFKHYDNIPLLLWSGE